MKSKLIGAVKLGVAIFLIGSVFGSLGANAAQAVGIEPTPNPGGDQSSFADVSCSGESFCMAVDNSELNGGPYGTAEKWNGTKWALQTNFIAPGPLNGISCASTTWCIAVGNAAGNPVAELWNGSSWSAQSISAPTGATQAVLRSISCTDKFDCTAVGSYYLSGFKALAERWNGTSWSVQSTPALPGGASGQNAMRGVSCSSSTSCTAVGSYYIIAEKVYVADAEQWNGTEWSLQAMPEGLKSSKQVELEDVSCPSTSFCMAVGKERAESGTFKVLALTWQFKTWNRTNAPNPTEAVGNIALHGVSCLSETRCTTVGSYVTEVVSGWAVKEKVLVDETAGEGGWVIGSSANREGYELNSLAAVYCRTTTSCISVGRSQKEFGGEELTLAEVYGTIEPTPNPGGDQSSFADISCSGSEENFCMAVDNSELNGGPYGTAEKWNGTKWALQTGFIAPGPLNGISCASTTWCIAVGNAGGNPVAELWNGSSWSAQSISAPTGATQAVLRSISCTDKFDCTAVGSYYLSGYKALAERWNGTSWSVQSTPALPGGASGQNAMQDVSCSSSTSCTAVGSYYITAEKVYVADAEHWNGTEWSLQAMPESLKSMKQVELESVSCPSTSFCMAVGKQRAGLSGQFHTLALSWSPSTWNVTTTPNPAEAVGNIVLHGVACYSSTACSAVGSYVTEVVSGLVLKEKVLVEEYGGATGWFLSYSENRAGYELNSLAAVYCRDGAICIGVGRSQKEFGGEELTLAQEVL